MMTMVSGTGAVLVFLCLLATPTLTTGFVPRQKGSPISRATRAINLRWARVSMSAASEVLAASQAKTVAAIREAIPDIAAKPAASWPADAGETVAGAPAVLEAFDGPGPPNLAWMSSLNVEGKLSSLTMLNGPLTDVPHFCSRCVLDEPAGTLSLFIDWRPRAYGAYELKKEDGSYPGPEELGRDAFTYSSARTSMEARFYTEELQAFVAETLEALGGGGFTSEGPVNEEDALTRGPFAIDVSAVPLSDETVATVAAARAKAAALWLAWQVDEEDAHAHRPGAPINSQYVFDTPAKQNMYVALRDRLQALYGDDGVRLAAADSGPLDEGYVGGAS